MKLRFTILSGFILSTLVASHAYALQSGQSTPKRLYSIGDSITRGFDAYLPLDNKNLSWVNGYYGFWQRILGLPNTNSHYQRIQNAFGSSGTQNWMSAEVGAEMNQFAQFASGVAGRNVTYSTVMLGANDVCANSPAALPTDAEFENNFRAGMNNLLNNLPNGATVFVAAIPNIKQLYDLGQNKKALGIVNCEIVWSVANICQSMLDSSNSEADRAYVMSRNNGFNTIMQNVTSEYQTNANSQGKKLFFQYSSATTDPFTNSDISNIDCFHPSERGQKLISEKTWKDGPFNGY